MNLFTIGILIIFYSALIHALNDKEIDTIKHLVDEELLKREVEVLSKAEETRPNEIVHPLGGRMSKNKPILKTTKLSVSEKPNRITTKPTKTIPTRETKQTTEAVHPHENLQGSIDNCIDVYDTQKCNVLINMGMDCNKNQMNLMCEKSCGFCGNFGFPVSCEITMHGCCNDGFTPKSNPKGTNCPKCKDAVVELCKPHQSDCNVIGMVGNWMRANCKLTCGLCIPDIDFAEPKTTPKPCEDDEEQSMFCPSWKESGLCKAIPKLMKKHCKKTCNMCS